MAQLGIIIFEMYFLSVSGWVLESIQESIVRRRPVSKGFFRGPYVPIHGICGICVYFLGSLFKAYPPLVFLAGMAVCTAAEYITALFLEKCFGVKCWDYTTYPHTKWCQFQGRICLTMSLLFGVITLFVVYVYWDTGLLLARRMGKLFWPVTGILYALALIDVIFSCAKYIRARKQGIKIRSWAAFSKAELPE
jgi:uncharacterized membrane protein